jgi:hypothetical protein
MKDESCQTTKNNCCGSTAKTVLCVAAGVMAVLLAWKLTPSVIRYYRISRM